MPDPITPPAAEPEPPEIPAELWTLHHPRHGFIPAGNNSIECYRTEAESLAELGEDMDAKEWEAVLIGVSPARLAEALSGRAVRTAERDASRAEVKRLAAALDQTADDVLSVIHNREPETWAWPLFALRDLIEAERAKCAAAEASLAEARAEVARLVKILAAPDEWSISSDGILSVEHWAVKHIAESFARSLGDAPNFVTMDGMFPDGRRFAVTVQVVEGKTPAERIRDLTAEVARLRAALAEIAAFPARGDAATHLSSIAKRALEAMS